MIGSIGDFRGWRSILYSLFRALDPVDWLYAKGIWLTADGNPYTHCRQLLRSEICCQDTGSSRDFTRKMKAY